MPSRVPSQNTRQPRATSFAATARPGKMWPPVPPVVIITRPLMRPPRCGAAHTVNPRRSADFGSAGRVRGLHARSARMSLTEIGG